jgi:protein gp37
LSIKTGIEYVDSSVNEMAGCDGCELWEPKKRVRRCYAGRMFEQTLGGRPGWPEAFDKPEIFAGRIADAAGWPDLTGMDRRDKPWLNGMPRIIFVNDMGDTWTKSLDPMWLSDRIPVMRDSPHLWLLLTKSVSRMTQFFDRLRYVPDNLVLGTSVTGAGTEARLESLLAWAENWPSPIKLWASFEPITGPPSDKMIEAIRPPLGWLATGAESGIRAHPSHPAWIDRIVRRALRCNIPVFFKSWGRWMPVFGDLATNAATTIGVCDDGRVVDDVDEALRLEANNLRLTWSILRAVGKGFSGNELHGKQWLQVPDWGKVSQVSFI